jgi:YD repeat-containing protein
LKGITSETDPNGKTSYFGYDGLGRLKEVIDFDENLIKAIDYQYKVR